MSDLLTILNTIATGARLAATARRAGNGDPEALGYLVENWHEVLDLAQPGLGTTARQILSASRDAYLGIRSATGTGDVVDAEYREVTSERMPWSGFVRYLDNLTWSSNIIVGRMGEGKTQLALKLAYRWALRTGYPIEAVNIYHEDITDFPLPVRRIGLEEIARRMRILTALLAGKPIRRRKKKTDEPTEPDEEVPSIDQLSFRNRIIIIDEASLVIGKHGTDRGRILAQQAMAQARHLQWHLLYLGQLTGMIPLQLMTTSTMWIKRPAYEFEFDRQDPAIQARWRDAIEAFETVKQSPWYQHYPDLRAWAYVISPPMGNWNGYKGLVPFSLVSEVAEGEDSE